MYKFYSSIRNVSDYKGGRIGEERDLRQERQMWHQSLTGEWGRRKSLERF
jgi:hypothetical protein